MALSTFSSSLVSSVALERRKSSQSFQEVKIDKKLAASYASMIVKYSADFGGRRRLE